MVAFQLHINLSSIVCAMSGLSTLVLILKLELNTMDAYVKNRNLACLVVQCVC